MGKWVCPEIFCFLYKATHMKGSKFLRIIRNHFIEPRYFLKGSCNVSDIDIGCGLCEKFSFLASSKNFLYLKKTSCIYLVVLYYTLIWGVRPWAIS